METKDIPTQPISEWQPITSKADLAHLGKLGEEVCELGSAIFRCIIQGINEVEPVTKKPNRQWLEEEIADVLALLEHAIGYFGLDQKAMTMRQRRKYDYKAPWFQSLEDQD